MDDATNWRIRKMPKAPVAPGDVDPRKESQAHCALISDKARCIAGGVLELVCAWEKGILGKKQLHETL